MTALEAAPSTKPALVPISQRKGDWFFVVFMFYFGLTSTFGDSTPAIGPPDENSWWFMSRLIYKYYALHTDPLVMTDPVFVRVACFFAAYVFAPLHFVMAYAFYKGHQWIRTPALIWTGAMFEGSMIFLWAATFGDRAFFERVCPGVGFDFQATNMLKMYLFNVWYVLVPAIMMVRLWNPQAFRWPTAASR